MLALSRHCMFSSLLRCERASPSAPRNVTDARCCDAVALLPVSFIVPRVGPVGRVDASTLASTLAREICRSGTAAGGQKTRGNRSRRRRGLGAGLFLGYRRGISSSSCGLVKTSREIRFRNRRNILYPPFNREKPEAGPDSYGWSVLLPG